HRVLDRLDELGRAALEPARRLLLQEPGSGGERQHDQQAGGGPAGGGGAGGSGRSHRCPRLGGRRLRCRRLRGGRGVDGVGAHQGITPVGIAPTSTSTSSTSPRKVAAQSSSIRRPAGGGWAELGWVGSLIGYSLSDRGRADLFSYLTYRISGSQGPLSTVIPPTGYPAGPGAARVPDQPDRAKGHDDHMQVSARGDYA